MPGMAPASGTFPGVRDRKDARMARMLLLLGTLWLALAILSEHAWEWFRLDPSISWALLLPGVYLVGMFLLRD